MSQAVETTVVVADNSAFSTNAIALGVRDLDLIGDRQFGVVTGKRGTRQEFACRARVLSDNVTGGFNIFPTDAELDWLLERAIGDSIASYPAAALVPKETIPGWFLAGDKGGVQTFRYDDLRINRLTISGAETQMLNARVDLTGSTESEITDLGSPPTPDCDTVFHFSDIELVIGGTSYPIKSFELSLDNQIVDQYENSLTKTQFESQILMVRLRVTCAYRSDTKALYRRAIAGDAATLTIDDATNSYEMTFANVKIPGRGPTIPESGEVTMPLDMMCYRTVAAPVISIEKNP